MSHVHGLIHQTLNLQNIWIILKLFRIIGTKQRKCFVTEFWPNITYNVNCYSIVMCKFPNSQSQSNQFVLIFLDDNICNFGIVLQLTQLRVEGETKFILTSTMSVIYLCHVLSVNVICFSS